jgi:hypothetical protein
LGDCLCNLGSFLKGTEVIQLFGLLISIVGKTYVFIFTQKRVRLHFGRFSHQLIWPPCEQSSLNAYIHVRYSLFSMTSFELGNILLEYGLEARLFWLSKNWEKN